MGNKVCYYGHREMVEAMHNHFSGEVQQMETNTTKVHYQLLLLMPWVRSFMAWWQSEQKAVGTERSMRRGWQQRFQKYDVT